MVDHNRALVDEALTGSKKAQRALIAIVLPVIERRVGVTLARFRRNVGLRDIRQEKADFTQEVLIKLFDRDGSALRKWDVERLPLEGFVGVIADHEVVSILRSRPRNPWTEEPTEQETLDFHDDGGARSPEIEAASREELRGVLEVIESKLSQLGYYLFCLIYLDERSVEEVCMVTGMTTEAVYQWRSRLARDVRKYAVSFMSEKRSEARRRGVGGDLSHEER